MTEINSEITKTQNLSEPSLKLKDPKMQENLFTKFISLMNKNPNYKMLGALGMMLLNFSVCVTVANWLKNSSLVS